MTASVVKIAPDTERHVPVTYPQVSQFERLEHELTEAMNVSMELSVAAQSHEIDRLRPAIKRARSLVESGALANLQHDVGAVHEPATEQEIAARIAVMIKSIPNPGKEDLATYGRVMREDVGAHGPTRLGLEIACRRLRRTSEWLPKIPQVLAALQNAEDRLKRAPHVLGAIPQRLAEAERELERELAWERKISQAKLTPLPALPAAPNGGDVGEKLAALSAELRASIKRREREECELRRGPTIGAPIALAAAAALDASVAQEKSPPVTSPAGSRAIG